MRFPSAFPATTLQVTAAVVGLIVLTLSPPASGRMLVVPLVDRDANAVALPAVAGGAALLGPGPLPGSLVVTGNRARIARQFKDPVVITAAPAAECGTATGEGAG